jgi:hypothetical protein
MQVFNWLMADGVDRRRDKYALRRHALDDSPLAERLFTSALNLAELRRGALFVVLTDPEAPGSC